MELPAVVSVQGLCSRHNCPDLITWQAPEWLCRPATQMLSRKGRVGWAVAGRGHLGTLGGTALSPHCCLVYDHSQLRSSCVLWREKPREGAGRGARCACCDQFTGSPSSGILTFNPLFAACSTHSSILPCGRCGAQPAVIAAHLLVVMRQRGAAWLLLPFWLLLLFLTVALCLR